MSRIYYISIIYPFLAKQYLLDLTSEKYDICIIIVVAYGVAIGKVSALRHDVVNFVG